MAIFAESARLILRRARDDDLEPLLPAWSDPKMTRYTEPRDDPRAFLATLIADMQAKAPGETEPGGPWYQYMIARKADGALVGDIGVGFGVPGERQAELGYRILPAFQRQGYAREALAAIIDHLIAAHALHRFTALVASRNIASIAVLKALGFRHEGHFRESFWRHGEWLDDDFFALLASEWRGTTSPTAS